jgi:hypothetical protein
VLLRLDLGTAAARPFIVAGPYGAYRASCKLAFSVSGLGGGESDCDAADDSGSNEDPIKKFDAGGIVGLGIAGSVGGRSLSAQVRYSQGFVNLATTDSGSATPKNSGISLLFGIGF